MIPGATDGSATGRGDAPDRVLSQAPAARTHRAVLLAFFASGVAGLMHQVVWAKLLVTLIGTTAYAQAAVLAVFLGGLAIGAVWLGRRVDRQGEPLRLYESFTRVRSDMDRLDIPSFAAFLGYQRLSSEAIRGRMGAGPRNTIAHPRLEYAAPRAMFTGHTANLLKRLDPLRHGKPADGTLLLDRYAAHRAEAHHPVAAEEIEEAAFHFETLGILGGDEIGASIRSRGPAPANMAP